MCSELFIRWSLLTVRTKIKLNRRRIFKNHLAWRYDHSIKPIRSIIFESVQTPDWSGVHVRVQHLTGPVFLCAPYSCHVRVQHLTGPVFLWAPYSCQDVRVQHLTGPVLIETFIATVFNTIQSNLLTECIQVQFLKDCTSKHVGPIVSYKGF